MLRLSLDGRSVFVASFFVSLEDTLYLSVRPFIIVPDVAIYRCIRTTITTNGFLRSGGGSRRDDIGIHARAHMHARTCGPPWLHLRVADPRESRAVERRARPRV